MKVLLAPAGTRGDVAPLVALGVGLRARGHEVLVLAPTGMDAFVAANGLDVATGGMDITELLIAHRHELHRPIAVVRVLVEGARAELEAQISGLEARVADFDLVVGAGVQIAASSVAAAFGVPYRTVLYTPTALPGPSTAPFWLPWRGGPRWLNRALHLLPDRILGTVALGRLQRWRAVHGLPPELQPLYALIGSHPLLATHPLLAPAPTDGWPIATQLGWLRPPCEPALDPALLAFLDDGPPPLYLGYGSMVDADAAGTIALVAALCRGAGVRAIVCRGWSATVPVPDVPGLLVIDGAPHGRLLPRCACAIHHGGAGTTHAAASAGIPQLVVPHLLDQFEWGYRVAQLGLGPAPLRRRALNLKSLSTAVQLMLHDAAMRARAAEVGVALRADDGVGRGVDELERFVAAWHATAPLARCIWSPSRPIVAKRPKPRGLPDALALPPLPPRPTLWPLVLAALLLLAALLAAAYSTAANVALALK